MVDRPRTETDGLGDESPFVRYLTTTYSERNDLSEAGLEKAIVAYGREFGHLLPSDNEAAILDVGCGTAGFLSYCHRRGYTHLDGVDISPEQVEFCRRLGFDGVECAHARSFLRDARGRYALILMSDVLEHLPKEDVLATLRHARERLEPGGRLVLRVPNLSNPLNLRTRYVDFTHEAGFTIESVGQVLRMAEFEIETMYGAFGKHRRWLARVLFDVVLWKLFRLFYRHTMHLKDDPVRGKNLIAVARRGG